MSETLYNCVRCGTAHQWGHLTSTSEGNLFCPSCWKELQNEQTRNCPVDGVAMRKQLIAEAINIDVCPVCDGRWFDKSELEILLRKATDEGWSGGFLLGLGL